MIVEAGAVADPIAPSKSAKASGWRKITTITKMMTTAAINASQHVRIRILMPLRFNS